MTDLWPEVAADLEAIIRRAGDLDDRYPEPAGLPRTGSWIRAIHVDDDNRGRPETPWHLASGWRPRWGTYSTRCASRASRPLAQALKTYTGQPLPRRSWDRYILEVLDERPAEGACRQCTTSIARDEARVVRAAEEAHIAALVTLLPVLEALATDPALGDVERGRQLRELWPVS